MSELERRKQCTDHVKQDEHIEHISRAIAKHSGQWKILMWGVSLLAGAVISFGFMIHQTAANTQKSVINIDKTFSTFMGVHIQESKYNDKRINNAELMLTNHEQRIDSLEKRN